MAGRRYRSRAEWQALIDRQVQSGLGVSEFCRRHGLIAKYFHRKRRQLRDAKALVPTGGAFVRVSPEPSSSLSASNSLELQFRESRLQLPATTDPAWLARLLQSL